MAEHVTPTRTYYLVFGSLMVLTLLTVVVAFLPIGFLHTPVALAVAITKATLVVLFFMHVIHSSRLTWVVIFASIFMLMILIALTLSDYWTREWIRV